MAGWEIIKCIDKTGDSYKRRNLTTGELQDFEMTDKMTKWLLEAEREQDAKAEWRDQRSFDTDMYNRSSSS